MLRTRLLVGSLLALGACGVLFGDSWLAGRGLAWFPFLFAFLMFAGVTATAELCLLFPPAARPGRGFATLGVLACLLTNWLPLLSAPLGLPAVAVWPALVGAFVGMLVLAFVREILTYAGDGTSVPRVAHTALILGYLGVLPVFFAQIRWLSADVEASALMLALLLAVPKGNDVGAYFAGTFLGRHKMTPLLSPKKTWEGFAGGMLAGTGVAVGLSFVGNVFRHGVVEAAAFGLVVGGAGVLGDLAESLLKRDGHAKDAAKSIPGFGGLMDVVDSVLFAAPVAYLWFCGV
ncbi:MAG: phosphatidate cytidylyltransferase [Gemmataceae bacterium]|nr:phosphatidate cytidylyltransferase [Gemmataceae bacterium]